MTREELTEAPIVLETEGHVQRTQGRRQPREGLTEAPAIPETEMHVQKRQGRRRSAAGLAEATRGLVKSTIRQQQQRKKYSISSLI